MRDVSVVCGSQFRESALTNVLAFTIVPHSFLRMRPIFVFLQARCKPVASMDGIGCDSAGLP